MLHGEVSLKLETFKNVLSHHPELGDGHVTLVGGEKWYSDEAKARLNKESLDELHRLGLASGNRASPDFYDIMVVLQRPGIEHYTFARMHGTSVTVRTAAIGSDCVLVVSDGETLTLQPIRAEELTQQLAHALPETPAADVLSMSCLESDYQAIVQEKSVQSSSSVLEAKRIKPWLLAERVHVGQLYTAIRDSGGRHRNERPPFWIDTPNGRVIASVDNAGWLSVQGAAPTDISRRLTKQEAELRGR